MTIVLPVGSTPSGFGVRLSETGDYLEIITQCCQESLEYQFDHDGAPPIQLLPGSPDGGGLLKCSSCHKYYRGYSNTTRTITRGLPETRYREDLLVYWMIPWTGLPKDAQIEVKF